MVIKLNKILVFVSFSCLIANLILGCKNINSTNPKVTLLTDSKIIQPLVRDIGQAKKEIICALYIFKNSEQLEASGLIISSLKYAAGKNIKIKIFLNASDDLSYEYNKETKYALTKYGIEVYLLPETTKLHAKTCVIDNNISYIGSHNYTYSAIYKNHEVTSRIVSYEVAEETKKFILSLNTFL